MSTNFKEASSQSGSYLKKIVVKNWRQYKGKVSIQLEPEKNRRVNAIVGKNGTGKTNLAKAVSACLLGSVPGEEDVGGIDPHVNTEVLNRLSEGETASGYIKLHLVHQGTDIVIERSFESPKRSEGRDSDIEDELKVQRRRSSGWEQVENPNTFLGRILPPEVQQYYFFDGERLDDLFESGYEDDVKDAVRELSQIEALECGIDHLGKLRDERRRKAKRNSGDVQQAEDELAQREAEWVNILHDKADVERRIQKKEPALADIESKMGAASDKEVLDLHSERATLETKVDNLKDEEDELEAELDRLLVETGTVNFAMDALTEVTEQLERLGANGQLPPDIRRSYLNELLDDGQCVCGCNLEKHPHRREEVETVRDKTPSISERTIDASYEFPRVINEGDESFDKLRSTKSELRTTRKNRLAKEEKREELKQQLRSKNVPDVDLDQLDHEREQLRAELKSLRTELGQLEERLETKESEIETAKEHVETELAKNKRNEKLMQEVDLYKRAQNELVAIKSSLMQEVLDAVADSLDTYYNELTWKDESYDLSLDEDFSIHIKGPDSVRHVASLSAGETEILALSFIAALTEVSGFDAPVLIDTPLGRIDQAHRKAIADKLPGYLEGHQLTFLFTDSEYNDIVESELQGQIANKYLLKNDNRATRVCDYAATMEVPNDD